MRGLSFVALASLAACTSAPPPPAMHSAKAQARLAEELSGLVPGQAVSCLPRYRANDMVAIDDSTLLFKDGTTRVYRNDVQGNCSMLGGPYALVTRSSGSSLCRGDIAQVADVQNGITVGSCVLGDFVLYSKP